MIGLLGDSLSVGTFGPLSARLPGEVVLFARVGAPISWMAGQVDAMSGVSTVLVMGGTNDLVGAQPEVVLGRLDALVARLVAAGHPVVVGTIPTQQGAGAAAVLAFNGLLLAHPWPKGAVVRDIGGAVGVQDLGPDGIHPTARGYDKLAGAWTSALTSGSEIPPKTEAPALGFLLIGAVAALLILSRHRK